jgi:serine/threonine protein kinase
MPTDSSSEPLNKQEATPDTRSLDQSSQPTAPPFSEGDAGQLTLRPGARPLPDYELVRKLGEGGFGEVWQARGPGGMDVALKFIRLDAHGSALEVRSLEVMKAIRHPNLVSLFGAWDRGSVLILAMELRDRSLHDRLKEALGQNLPGIPMKELLNYMRDAAHGLDALNEQHVQHRDIKPANLLLLHRGVKVADFGLAKVLEGSVGGNTGAMTPAYATPECFRGQVTKHSDQYSFAVTYYHLRTGRLLFSGSFEQVMFRHLTVEPDLAGLPAGERAVLARALAKDPEKRWRNCKVFVNELIKAYTADQSRPPDPPKNEPPPKEPAPKSDRLDKRTPVNVEPVDILRFQAVPIADLAEPAGRRRAVNVEPVDIPVLKPAPAAEGDGQRGAAALVLPTPAKRRLWPLLVPLLVAALLVGGCLVGSVGFAWLLSVPGHSTSSLPRPGADYKSDLRPPSKSN